MRAEIEFYNCPSEDDYELVDASQIQPGHIEGTDFFGQDIKLLTACNPQNKSCMVRAYPEQTFDINQRLRVVKYRDEKDNYGEDVTLDEGKVKIEWPEELSLLLYDGEVITKEIAIFLPSDDFLETEGDFIPDTSRQLVKI